MGARLSIPTSGSAVCEGPTVVLRVSCGVQPSIARSDTGPPSLTESTAVHSQGEEGPQLPVETGPEPCCRHPLRGVVMDGGTFPFCSIPVIKQRELLCFSDCPVKVLLFQHWMCCSMGSSPPGEVCSRKASGPYRWQVPCWLWQERE